MEVRDGILTLLDRLSGKIYTVEGFRNSGIVVEVSSLQHKQSLVCADAGCITFALLLLSLRTGLASWKF